MALKVASESTCAKRKVGALITSKEGDKFEALAEGCNYSTEGTICEDIEGNTLPSVVHAEKAAILTAGDAAYGAHMFVTHQPCSACLNTLTAYTMTYEVVEEFMKFDSNKLRYDLIPPSATRALAEGLTYGCKKYKPNNWKTVSEDEHYRYVGAVMRHFEAYRGGEKTDPESGLPHLTLALTNIAFLIELDS